MYLELEVREPGFEALDEFDDLLCLQIAVVEKRGDLVLVSEPVEQSDQAAGRVVLAELQLPVGEANGLALADLDILHGYRPARGRHLEDQRRSGGILHVGKLCIQDEVLPE